MAGYFSLRKVITTYFVKLVYALGFIALTVGGLGLAAWAGLRLNDQTMPTRTAVYFIAAGAAILLAGNLAWRMICEFWLLLFNMHTLLGSIERKVSSNPDQQETKHSDVQSVERQKSENGDSGRTNYGAPPGRSVLGLS